MQRQIPLETVFMSNSTNSWRDPTYTNRIHFKFPDTWTENISKDSIIGIRNMFISKGHRSTDITISIRFKIAKTIVDYITLPTPGTTYHHDLDATYYTEAYTISLKKLFDDSTTLIEYTDRLYEKATDTAIKAFLTNAVFVGNYGFSAEETSAILNAVPKNLISPFFIYEDHHCNFHIHNHFKDVITTFEGKADLTDPGYTGQRVTTHKIDMEFKIAFLNEDCKALLNGNTTEYSSEDIIFKDVWDRNSCILYSNLAYMSENSYLGHTRKYPLPKLKYYVLTSSNKTFWVDLFDTCDHEAPVVLPLDNKDELFIEAQLLTSSSAVL